MMNTQQKTIIIILLAVVGLNFGSLTKAKKIWTLAFTPAPSSDTTGNKKPVLNESEILPIVPSGLRDM